MNVTAGVMLTPPKVYTSSDGGLKPEQLAEIATNKIIYADEGTIAPVIYQQAMAFKLKINRIVLETIRNAKRSSYVDFIAEAEKAGLTEMANALKARLNNGDY
jgi:hypothetical protein